MGEESQEVATRGEELYEAQGRPIFGKIWTYAELQAVDRPKHKTGKDKITGEPLKTPDNWPGDTVIDTGSKWVMWLPEGWMQGVRTSAAGKILKCYFTPEGKRFWHKKDIEKYLGYLLPTREPAPKDEDEDGGGHRTARVRYVTDNDAIPNWPEDDTEWLPKDFKIGFRQLPSGLHRIYIPPGQDEGFLWHRSTVEEYLMGGGPTLSKFGSSMRMAEISANAAQGQGRSTGKRPRRGSSFPAVTENDYEESTLLAVALLTVQDGAVPRQAAAQQLRDGGAASPRAEELAELGGRLYALLRGRGFPESTELVAVFGRSRGAAGEDGGGGKPQPVHPMLEALSGFYVRLPEPFGERACYQRVRLAPGPGQLACGGIYLFWSTCRGCWKFGPLDDERAGAAFSGDGRPGLAEVGRTWMLLKLPAGDKRLSDGGVP